MNDAAFFTYSLYVIPSEFFMLILQNTDNPFSLPANPDALPPLLRDSLLSSVRLTCIKYPSAPVYGYHKAVLGYPDLLRSRCRWNVHYIQWHVLLADKADAPHERFRHG